MPSIAIVDSGPLVASANPRDPDHEVALRALQSPGLRLVVPTLCVVEAAYFIGLKGRAVEEARFLRGLSQFDVRGPDTSEWGQVANLVEKYSDLPLGAVDAFVVVLAERLRTDLIITLDHRHFRVVRPQHFDAFRLLPATLP
ncbi:MAG: type II toxin-antitoxin system VapC family toxin [Thermoanaerobaculia bacterium]